MGMPANFVKLALMLYGVLVDGLISGVGTKHIKKPINDTIFEEIFF